MNRSGQNRLSPNNEESGPGPQSRQTRASSWRLLVWALFFALVFWLTRGFFGGGSGEADAISYSTFREALGEGQVEQVTITGTQIRGQFEAAPKEETGTGDGSEPAEVTNFVTYLPSFGDESLLPLLERQGVEVKVQPEADYSWLLLLLNGLPFLLLILLGFLFFSRVRSQGQNLFSIGQSRARLYRHEDQAEPTTFNDVAGADGAKLELSEIIEFLKNPKRFERLGGENPRGVLLVGPPGTGKTLLARAVAGEAGVPFFSISGSDFMEMLVGVGASRVRKMFEEAKKAAPCIIFIDEIDSIGRRRGAGLGGGHDEREQTLNQLLSELDGFEPHQNVIVIAATNRPDILDPALLRPGRFDRRITVELPTTQSRVAILEIHARNKPLKGVDLDALARGTPGFSGADLKNVLNEAALLAARNHKDFIEQAEVEEARDKILMGLKRENLALTQEECELLAYHEAGHAVIAAVLPYADPIHKVTIIPRGRAMGVTQQLPEREKYIYPRAYLLDRLAVMMGGRAAENLVLDTATSGAENDLKQATHLARKMVIDWGMSPKLGRVAWGGEREQVFLGEEIGQRREYSESTAEDIDAEIKAILNEAYERAVDTLQTYRAGLDGVAQALLDHEELIGSKVLKLVDLESVRVPTVAHNGRKNT